MRIYEIENTKENLKDIWKLTYDIYSEQGYCKSNSNKTLRHYPHLDLIPETHVFVAEEDGILHGTITLTMDNKNGLPINNQFQEINNYRYFCSLENKNLATVWRMVTRKKFRNKCETVINLMNRTVKDGIRLGIDYLIIELNPKHEKHYKRMLGLETISQEIKDDSLNNAPAILMAGEIGSMEKHWNKFYNRLYLKT